MKINPDASDIYLAVKSEIAPYSLARATTQKKVEAELGCLILSGADILKVGQIFRSELDRGISDQPSSLLMENTYVPELPDGTEEGEFLALDLGGTNFRMLYLVLTKGKVTEEKIHTYHISDELRSGPGQHLFDFLAQSISDFVHELGIADKHLPLGFTFSFPMHQRSLDVGLLVNWTKTFSATGVEGQDVVSLLEKAVERRGDNHVEVVAILNDTTGTLMQGASIDRKTCIGLILGTGSNACYLERADMVSHWESERHGEKEIIIDTEWGAFGDNGVIDFIKTSYDKQVDKNSLFEKSYTFEKYISGKYLGETVRVVLAHLAGQGLLFESGPSSKLLTPNTFLTNYVSHIEQDTVNESTVETEKVMKLLDQSYSNDDIVIIKLVCELVSLRAAILISICLAELLKKMSRPEVTVAVDGSLYIKHPRFKSWMEKFVALLAPSHPFYLMLTEDGSGKGAAFTAAIALKLRNRQ